MSPDPDQSAAPAPEGIAIVGMAGRFPGAETLAAFWENLTAGRETISTIPLEEIPDEENKSDPDYIPRRGLIEKPEWFDAAFFNMSPREAEVTDPQQRAFLEACWHALEHAGCDPARFPGSIGVYAGMSNNSWLHHQILPSAELRRGFGYESAMIANEKDYLATRTAYKLDLRGPALNIYTACSTSLVAVCQAVQALQAFACDAALAGGVSIKWPQARGYTAQEGSLYSPDGHCRPYDAGSRGTVFSNGLGVVLLKRVEDALRDGDHIWAVIKGAALNNDGAGKASFTAPSVEGHAEVISLAHALAGIDPGTISYVEGHGTATPIGDPIEVAGLTKAFRLGTERKNFCGLGSLKSATGHMDAAAGIGGLIKTALSLHHRQLPPTLHFRQANPALGLEDSPFYVVDRLKRWTSDFPLRAGVSSFGVGGTNAHVVLEEAPLVIPSDPPHPQELLVLSAKTPTALEAASLALADWLTENPDDFSDAAWTLQTGRKVFPYRRAVAAADAAQAAAALRTAPAAGPLTPTEARNLPIAFLFPGQGSQHPGMGLELCAREPVFKQAFTECLSHFDLPGLMDAIRGLEATPESSEAPSAPGTGDSPPAGAEARPEPDAGTVSSPLSAVPAAASRAIDHTALTQPALFTVGYATARLLQSWGLQPAAMIGHSIGEYVAATLAGVMSLPDAARLVAARGRLMAALPAGSMLAVRLPEEEIRALLPAELDTATVNAPNLTVVSGPDDSITAFAAQLEAAGHGARRLQTSHAFHSAMMEPALEAFRAEFAGVTLRPPQLPYLSNLTGEFITAAEAASPDYYVRHLRGTVRFADNVAALCRHTGPCILLECGPGTALAPAVRQHPAAAESTVISCFPPAGNGGRGEHHSLFTALGQAWAAGLHLDWDALRGQNRRLRVPLPLYPFERRRFCPDTPQPAGTRREGEAWLLPPDAGSVPAGSATLGTSPSNTAAPSADNSFPPPFLSGTSGGTENAPVTEDSAPAPENGTPSAGAPSAPVSRRDHLLKEISAQLHRISGIDPSGADPSTSFLDLGFDSLFLTSAGTALTRHFSLKITFRQLMEDQGSLADLADWLDGNLPAGAFEPASPDHAAPPATAAAQALTAGIPAPSPAPHAAGQDTTGLISSATSGRLAVIEEQIRALRSSLAAVAGSAGGACTVPVSTIKGSDGKKIAFGPFKPIERQADGSLTGRQRQHLAELTAAYVAKYPKAKAFTAEHRGVFADPRAVAGFNLLWKEMVFPAVTERSEGAYLWDTDGHRWIDVVHGFGLGFFGHRPKFVTDALHEQLDKGFEIGPTSPLAGEVAHLIREFSGQERVAFCNTGSEALMAAIRTSRTISGRNIIAMFAGGYHGIFDEVLARPLVTNGELRSIPIAPGIPESAQAAILVLEYGNPESLEILRRFGHEVACVLVEPVMSRRPDVVPVKFVRELRSLTRTTGTALVFDEVVLGFRTGPGGAQDFFGIRADLVTYGKVLGGGMPLGVLCGSRHYMDALDGGAWQYGDDSMPEIGVTFFAGTFIRHPLTLAAARAVLLRLKEIGPDLQQAVEAKTRDFTDRLNRLFETAGVPLKATRFSSMWMLNGDPGLKYWGLLYYHLRLRGIHLWEGRPGFLSTAHTAQDVDEILTAFHESVAALQQGGFLPGGTEAPPPRLEEAPATPAQQEMFLASQMSEEGARACHEQLSLKLTGPLDTDILTKALEQLVSRHDSLRATFSTDGSTMRFHAEPRVNFREAGNLKETPGLPPRSLETALEGLREQEFLAPFDLEHGPLHRFLLVRTGAETAELILTAHHIICDGWSFGVLVHEFGQAWEAVTEGRSLPPAASYGEAAATRQRDHAAGLFAEDRAWWQEQFPTLPEPLLLPSDTARPPHPGYGAEAAEALLPADLAEKLRAFCAARRLTVYHALLTVYQILLHRLSGSRDFLIGMPVAGQPAAGTPDLTGHCVQFLPLRAALDPAEPAEALARRTRSLTLAAQEHQHVTLGEILDGLPGLSGPDRQHFVRATFSLEPAPEIITAGPLTAVPVGGAKRRLSFDLSLYVFQGQPSEGLGIRCAWRRDLFSRATVERWLEHFITLTESLVTTPEQEVRRLGMLSAAQRTLLLDTFHADHRDFPEAPCLHRWFEKTAAAFPDKTAVSSGCGEPSLTYAELNAGANRIAHWLISHGAGPEALVGLCLNRGPELITALLGILKAGAAYLPVDLSYPADRLAFMLEDAGARLLITRKNLARELPEHQGGTLFLDEAGELLAQQPADNPEKTAAHPEHPAYVIYTSGSTGRPKGCVVTHRNVSRLMLATEHWFGFNETDVWTLFHSPAFDFSVWEIWGALLYGGRLVTVPFLTSRSPDEFHRLLSEEGVTVLNQTPSAFRQLIHAEEAAEAPLPLALRYVIFGGEALEMQSLQPWFDRHGAEAPQLVNMYGITETTVHVTYRPLSPADTAGGSVIGVPIPDLRLYILDPDTLEPVPPGVPGEMYVGGGGLARGYLHRPELTAERFIPDHLTPGSVPGARLYKTGDLARFIPAGGGGGLDIEYLGRIDHQVKIRGFRIELGEIESTLTAHPGIRSAAVLARADRHGERKLYAYLIPAAAAAASAAGSPESSTPLTTAELRAHLLKTLPDYMVPGAFLFLDRFPLTPNGKLDQNALPTPDSTAIVPADDFVPPRTATQRRIAAFWEDILGSRRTGVRSDFFASGGTSLNALRLMQRIRQEFAVTLPLGVLFKSPTLGQLAEAVDQARTSPLLRTAGSALTCLQEGLDSTPLFLLHGGDGGALFYRALLPVLGPDASVYIIESPALTDDAWLLARKNVEATAHHFITLMQTVQPEGPYRIGGYSFGGLVAYEMAQQLRATGQTTERLIMFDTENPGVGVRMLSLAGRLAAGWRQGGGDFPGRVKGLGHRISTGLKERRQRDAETTEARGLLEKGIAATGPLRIIQVRETHVDAMEGYKVRPYAGSMLLLRSTAENDKYERLPDYGWGTMVRSIEIRDVPGNHLQLFDPANADALATQLKNALEQPPETLA